MTHSKVTDWAPHPVVSEVTLDTEATTISSPQRKLWDLQERLGRWPSARETATMRDFLVLLAEKLQYAVFVVRPGRYFVRRLLQLNKLHLSRDERAGGGEVRASHRKRAVANRALRLTAELMADVGWWR